MSLKHGLLGLINYSPVNGYELDKIFKDSLNFFWQAQTTQLYRELVNMEKKKWLRVELLIQNDKPNKKIYFITDDGREEFLSWLCEDNMSVNNKNEFLLKLFFIGELPKPNAIKFLHNYKLKCQNELEKLYSVSPKISEYTKLLDDTHKSQYWVQTSKFGVSYFTMCINWANNLIKELEHNK